MLGDDSRHGHVLTDSPAGNYASNMNIDLRLPTMVTTSPDISLAFSHHYDFEANYDFGYVELSTDGGINWLKAAQFTGRNS
jgi:hypothetical protein